MILLRRCFDGTELLVDRVLQSRNCFNNSKNFISSLNNDEERVVNSKSDNIEIMINYEADEVIKKLFDSFKSRCHLI